MLRTQDPHGVRVKGKHDGRAADFLGTPEQLIHNAAMPQMHAIKVANRHRSAAGRGGKLLKLANDRHW